MTGTDSSLLLLHPLYTSLHLPPPHSPSLTLVTLFPKATFSKRNTTPKANSIRNPTNDKYRKSNPLEQQREISLLRTIQISKEQRHAIIINQWNNHNHATNPCVDKLSADYTNKQTQIHAHRHIETSARSHINAISNSSPINKSMRLNILGLY